MITAEYWMEGINKVLDRYGLSREEFWKDPEAFINNLEDKDAKLTLDQSNKILDLPDYSRQVIKINT